MFFYVNLSKRITLKQLVVLLAALLISATLSAQDFGNIEFVENKGQWEDQVRYRSEVSNGLFYIRKGGFTVVQNQRTFISRLLIRNRYIFAFGQLPPTNNQTNRAYSCRYMLHIGNLVCIGNLINKNFFRIIA
ncbi:MAG: hypothetical protein EOP48_30665 [Sphingobacteriales bacterium]|nr:MAG: hypothetical protein EOP48_30665 [Sphingobacteriales bacterium]